MSVLLGLERALLRGIRKLVLGTTLCGRVAVWSSVRQTVCHRQSFKVWQGFKGILVARNFESADTPCSKTMANHVLAIPPIKL